MYATSARLASFAIAAMVGGAVLTPLDAAAQWWRSGPKDFEECADLAEKAATKAEKTSGLADCNAKFAGRRKVGGGYSYYDFMQERTYDIAGPNPTPQEQKKIDEEYTAYLAGQRRTAIATALAVKRQQSLENPQALPPLPPPKEVQQLAVREAALRTEPPKAPRPAPKPVKLQQPGADIPAPQPVCVKGEFSCDWPQLAEKWNGLKRMFGSSPPPPKTKQRS